MQLVFLWRRFFSVFWFLVGINWYVEVSWLGRGSVGCCDRAGTYWTRMYVHTSPDIDILTPPSSSDVPSPIHHVGFTRTLEPGDSACPPPFALCGWALPKVRAQPGWPPNFSFIAINYPEKAAWPYSRPHSTGWYCIWYSSSLFSRRVPEYLRTACPNTEDKDRI